MKNSLAIPLAILGAAVIVALGLYFGLQRTTPQPIAVPQVQSAPDIPRLTVGMVNRLEIHVEDIQQVMRSIQEDFRKTGAGGASGYRDIAWSASEVVGLVQQVRLQTADLPRGDSRAIRLLVDRVQHSAHELLDAADASDHEEAHHAFENLGDEVDSFEDAVKELAEGV